MGSQTLPQLIVTTRTVARRGYHWLRRLLVRWQAKKRLVQGAAYCTFLTILMVGLLGLFPVTLSSIMLQNHWADYRADKPFTPLAQTWVDYDDISPLLIGAVIAAEDQQFYNHYGIDFKEIIAAIRDYKRGSGLRGASTLTQQVAKNVFLSPSRSLARKGAEVWFTLWIELLWSKQRILEVYLNIAEWGDHRYGIEAASQHYFSISADKLNVKQAATLAAVLPNPNIYHADKPDEYVRKRQKWIMRQMRNLGVY